MENFILKINKIYLKDTIIYILFDIFINNVKIGESEIEWSVFNESYISKYKEYFTNKLENIKL